MNDAQIEHMVRRFLMWKLPANFCPDNGVSFDPIGSKGTPHEFKREPVGTNLLSFEQAREMVRHMVEDMPASPEDRVAAWQASVEELEILLRQVLTGARPPLSADDSTKVLKSLAWKRQMLEAAKAERA